MGCLVPLSPLMGTVRPEVIPKNVCPQILGRNDATWDVAGTWNMIIPIMGRRPPIFLIIKWVVKPSSPPPQSWDVADSGRPAQSLYWIGTRAPSGPTTCARGLHARTTRTFTAANYIKTGAKELGHGLGCVWVRCGWDMGGTWAGYGSLELGLTAH